MSSGNPKLKLGALTALVIGSMIGGGIFSLPQNMASGAESGAVLIGWAVTAVGMLSFAFVFQTLANRKPDLNNGVYAYAKAGFGNYLGFSSAWGYWISAWIGNVSYLILLFTTASLFIPAFKGGNSPAAIAGASVLMWAIHFMVMRGIKEATFVNTIVTVAKVVPLVTFIAFALFAFDSGVFSADIWGASNPKLGSVTDQVKSMMLVTVWVFIGIEGASVYSERAGRRSDVGKATVLGFICILALLVSVNVLSAGVMRQAELSGLADPSMAYVMERIVGKWGATFISVGLIVSLLGALLSWLLLAAESLYSASKDGTMPAVLHKENDKGVPVNALWASTLSMQAFLIIALFSEGTYLSFVKLATSMILIPYLFSTAYAALIAWRGETYEADRRNRTKDLTVALIGVIYGVWLIYAAGLQYLLLSSLLYAPGVLVYLKARREQGEQAFSGIEKAYLAVVLATAAIAAFTLARGDLTL